MSDKFYTVKQAAEFLGVTESSVRQNIKAKKLKAIRVLGKWYIHKGEFEYIHKAMILYDVNKNREKDKERQKKIMQDYLARLDKIIKEDY